MKYRVRICFFFRIRLYSETNGKFCELGHHHNFQVGGATAQVGDPSGRSKERPLLEAKLIESNSSGISENLQRIFKNHQQVFWDKGNEQPLSPLR